MILIWKGRVAGLAKFYDITLISVLWKMFACLLVTQPPSHLFKFLRPEESEFTHDK